MNYYIRNSASSMAKTKFNQRLFLLRMFTSEVDTGKEGEAEVSSTNDQKVLKKESPIDAYKDPKCQNFVSRGRVFMINLAISNESFFSAKSSNFRFDKN
jgi:hypothetical protein